MAKPVIQPAAVVTSVILTQSKMVPAAGSGVLAPRRFHRWWAVPLAALGVLLALLPLVFSFVPSTAFVDKARCVERNDKNECTKRVDEPVEFGLVPAEAQPVEPRVSITGVPSYPSDGQIYFVTITEPNISMVDWFVTRQNKAARMLSHHDKYGDQTEQQLTSSGQVQMRSAKDNAMYVALKAAGYPVELMPGQVIVDQLLCLEADAANQCTKSSPADDLLDPGDVLTKVDGATITIGEDLGAVLKNHEPGDKIKIEFTRAGEPMSGTITTILAPGEDPPRTIIGFRPVDTTTVKLPEGLHVQLKTDEIGGPSAGLAFTLTLIDELTPGDLMGGQRVAVTGTIDVEGHVGAIGGLNSKASAVLQTGVKYFLVPASQKDQPYPDNIIAAQQVVGSDVQIIPVATLEEALAGLEKIGGDPVQLAVPPTETTV